MARTPLLRLLTRSLRALRAHDGDERQALAALTRPRPAPELTRRGFLGASAALATAACATSSDRADPSALSSDRVVIVGGGIAGLHCAYRLSQVGVGADVYEASSRVGGRIKSDRTTFPDGMHCEVGGELIDTGHATMHDLATELGIELLNYANDDAALDHLVGHFNGAKVTQAQLLAAIAPVLPKVDEALKVLKNADANISYKNDNGAKALDAMSLAAWFDGAGVVGLARQLFEVAYLIEYGLEVSQTNCLNFLTLVGTDPMAFSLFGDSDEVFHSKNGNEAFTEKLAARLSPDAIKTGQKLVSLAENEDGTFTATFDTGKEATHVTASHVVLALPFTVLRDVDLKGVAFSDLKKKAIAEVGYGMSSKLMVGFSSRPWRLQASDGGTYADLGYQATWETSRLQPGASGIITNFTGGTRAVAVANGTDEALRDEFVGHFDKVFPGAAAAKNGKVVRGSWPTNPYVKAAYSSYLVGQYTTLAGSEGERYKNVHFAGEHTSRSAQGFMDGGALTGAIAASEIAKDLGVDGKVTSLDATAQGVWKRAFETGASERG